MPLADRARDPVQQVQAINCNCSFCSSSLCSVERSRDVCDFARSIDCCASLARAAGFSACNFRNCSDRSRDASGRVRRCRDRRSHDHSDEQQRGHSTSARGRDCTLGIDACVGDPVGARNLAERP